MIPHTNRIVACYQVGSGERFVLKYSPSWLIQIYCKKKDTFGGFVHGGLLPVKTMNSKLAVLLAAVLAAAMWCYADFILVPYQVADAARSGRPRGNLSDFYPRWLGARELLLRHRDPYSAEITREIQAGYYGRPLDSTRPHDPTDQQGFAYPVYVAFLLAPSVWLPFATVQGLFRGLLFFLITASVLLWLVAVRWRMSLTGTLIAVILVLGSFPAVQAIKLQQLTALVCVLLAGCGALVVNRRLAVGGVLLALATIKPQLALGFVGWLALWVVGDWRSRQRFVWSFLATLVTLIIGGEILLPGWIGEFRSATASYLQYAGGKSLLDLVLTPAWGRVASIIVIVAVGYICWKWRRAPTDSDLFRWTMALVVTALLTVIPTFAPYNQLLLIPALLLLAQRAPGLWSVGLRLRLCLALVGVVILLPWLAAVGVDLSLLFLPQAVVERGWALPLWTSWAIPFPVLAAVALGAAHLARERNSTADSMTAEIAL